MPDIPVRVLNTQIPGWSSNTKNGQNQVLASVSPSFTEQNQSSDRDRTETDTIHGILYTVLGAKC